MTPARDETGMNIAQFIDSYFPTIDGVVQTVANYQREIAARGGRCAVVAPATPGYGDPTDSDIFRYRSYALPQRPPYRLGLPMMDIGCRRAVDGYPLELVHVHSPFTCGGMGLTVARQRRVPIVGTFHSKYYEDFLKATRSEVISKTAATSIGRFYARLDEVWTVSEATAQTLREYGYRGPITIMPNGSDMPAPDDPDTVRLRAAELYGIPTDRPILLYVGQQIWQKNLRLILESMAQLKRDGVKAFLILVGEGADQGEIDDLIAHGELGDCVRRLGVVRDREMLAGLYLSARLLVFPSLYDNAPLVVREAAAMGLPALMVRGATCAQGVAHGHNGFLCEDSVVSMVAAITSAIGDEPSRLLCGIAAQKTLVTPWSKIVDSVMERYAYLIEAYAVGYR